MLYFVAWLIAFESVEASGWVSVAAAALAVLLFITAIPDRNYWALLVAVTLLGASVALFALRQARVNVMDESGPLLGIGVLFFLAEAPFVWFAWVKTPVLPSNPNKCRNCGYLLYGLTEARCPECGTPCDWFPPPR